MAKLYLKDVPSNPAEAEVDDKVLLRGDERNPTDLTKDQVERLEATGVKLERSAGQTSGGSD